VLNSGDVLADRYRLDEPIAAGGMGGVWQASDTVLGRRVAVKVVPARDPATQMRFRREAQAMAALSHPGIVATSSLGSFASCSPTRTRAGRNLALWRSPRSCGRFAGNPVGLMASDLDMHRQVHARCWLNALLQTRSNSVQPPVAEKCM
jgi:hypothetical protein